VEEGDQKRSGDEHGGSRRAMGLVELLREAGQLAWNPRADPMAEGQIWVGLTIV
jgi:hypothetical protein